MTVASTSAKSLFGEERRAASRSGVGKEAAGNSGRQNLKTDAAR